MDAKIDSARNVLSSRKYMADSGSVWRNSCLARKPFTYLPDDLVTQIWLYAVKCPHEGLGIAILRHALTPRIYDRLVEEKGIIIEDGHVVALELYDEDLNPHLKHAERSTIAFGIHVLGALPYLTRVKLPLLRGVKGDINVFASLPRLVRVDLYNTRVHGDIKAFSTLTRLTHLYLGFTNTHGNYSDLLVNLQTDPHELQSCTMPSSLC